MRRIRRPIGFARRAARPLRAAAEGRFRAGALFANRFRIVARIDVVAWGTCIARTISSWAAGRVEIPDRHFDPIERARARLRNEVRLARQLAHPNVCRVYDIGEAHGDLYLSMEYVDGEDLAALLKRIGRLPIDKGIEIARKLCAGLAAAHAKGVLHRDFKPANIMIDGHGEVRIMDFGLAAIADRSTRATCAAARRRTWRRSSWRGRRRRSRAISTRSDSCSTSYSREARIRGEDLHELQRLRRRHRDYAIDADSRYRPTVEDAILRCLEPDPKLRPASALAVAGHYRVAIHSPKRSRPGRRLPRRSSRQRVQRKASSRAQR